MASKASNQRFVFSDMTSQDFPNETSRLDVRIESNTLDPKLYKWDGTANPLIAKTQLELDSEVVQTTPIGGGGTSEFMFSISGGIRTGDTTDHRVSSDCNISKMQIFVSAAADADVTVAIKKNGSVVATGTLTAGSTSTEVTGLDIPLTFSDEIVANISTTALTGRNLRVRML